MTYQFVYISTNHSCCPLVLQMSWLGLLIASGHRLPIHPRPHPLAAAFHHLLQELQCAGPKPHLQEPHLEEPHHLTLLHDLGQLCSSHHQTVSLPAARTP